MDRPGMQIAIASGKGGTGKTTVATNLACIAARMGNAVKHYYHPPSGRVARNERGGLSDIPAV